MHMPQKKMDVDEGKLCYELDDYKKTQIKIGDLDISKTKSQPIKLYLQIGNSEFVEISGNMKIACIPSIHH
jgi:hypothetical protein